MSEKTIEAIKRHIDYMIDIEKILSLQLDWFGGEPFMYFKQVIRPICEYAQYKCQSNNIPYSVSATTNGYFLLPMIVGQLKELQFSKFQITLDGPKADHDKVKFQNNCESAFEHVLKNIENMLNHIENLQIYLRINYTEENLNPQIVEEISRIISVKNRGRIKITPKKVWQEDVRKERHYNVENLLELFEKEGYNTVRFDAISDFVPCYANRKYYTTINYNGDAVKCTACNDLYDNKSHGTLNVDGSIIWDKDFIKKYEAKSYENETCLACKYLPICMGVCPRDYGKPYCKLDRADFQIEDALVDYIEAYTKKRV